MADPGLSQRHRDSRAAINGTVRLATRDYGGSGPDLLFVPGAGQTLVDCDLLAPYLTAAHRVVAMDLRGHGASSDGPFSWEAALDDIEAVARTFDLDRPAVVGHSLGGMLAVMYGGRHPDSRGVVNLDGHGGGRPEHYADIAPDLLSARLAELSVLRVAHVEAARHAPATIPEVAIDATVSGYCMRYGLDEDFARAALARAHIQTDTGLTPRVAIDTTLEILASVEALDFDALYRACGAPLLVYNAIRPEPNPPGSPSWMPEHVAAFRRGVSTKLAALARERPRMEFLEIDATHALIYEQPELLSSQIMAFLAEQSS